MRQERGTEISQHLRGSFFQTDPANIVAIQNLLK